jgi:hypothetical protein
MPKSVLVLLIGVSLALSFCVCHSANVTPNKRALLVGINRYRSPNIRRLRGCRNDVAGMRSTLIGGSWGFDAKNIRTLEDDQATYDGIVK